MRRFDKNKSVKKANLLAEQRYLESKGLINENIGEEPISEVEPVNNEDQIPEVPEALKNEIMNFLSQQRVGSAAMANDNKVILYDYLETMWSPQDLHYGADSNEIRTNNPELMQKHLSKHGISGKRFVK